MPHSLEDDRTRKVLHRKLVEALPLAPASGSVLYGWDDQFKAFKAEAMKAVAPWMGDFELTGLLMDHYRKAVPFGLGGKSKLLPAGESISKEQIEIIANGIIMVLARVPMEYEISYPLPSFPKIGERIALTDHISLAPRNVSILPDSIKLEGAEIMIRANGFAARSLQSSALREAAAVLKVALRVGALREVFYEGRKMKPTSLPFSPGYVESDNSYFTTVREIGVKDVFTIKLGFGLSKYLEGISWIDHGTHDFPTELVKLAEPLQMVYHPEAEKNVKSIRRAIEWQFDAICDEDETTRFIKHCIGLEALLADQSEEMGITEQLADRCAFLLGHTSDERNRRRITMREVYRLRSKIVHGAVSGLSHKDVQTSYQASNLLATLLKVELESVEKWWARRLKRIRMLN